MRKVNLVDKLAAVSEYWRPKIVGELNGQEVKIVTPRATAYAPAITVTLRALRNPSQS
jgi:hypothetical protein